MIPGQKKNNLIDIIMKENESVNFPTEFLNSLNVCGMPLHSLKIESRLTNSFITKFQCAKVMYWYKTIYKTTSNQCY